MNPSQNEECSISFPTDFSTRQTTLIEQTNHAERKRAFTPRDRGFEFALNVAVAVTL